MSQYILGIDIGGTKCAVILGENRGHGTQKADQGHGAQRADQGHGDQKADRDHGEPDTVEIVDRIQIDTLAKLGADQTIERLFGEVEVMMGKYRLDAGAVAGIGISCGGPLDSERGIIMSPPNLLGWDDVPIVRMVQGRFHIPAFVQNDANACALAEWMYGAGRGYRNVVFLTCGTGMGAGLILDNRLYAGTSGMAGEVGHIRLAPLGPVGFGKQGSFEGFCSGGGIAQLARTLVLEQLQAGARPGFCPDISGLETLSAKTVADAAKAGDPLAREVYAVSGAYLGRGVAMLMDILNPEVIILGSIFERSGELLWEAASRVIEQEALVHTRNCCKVVPATLGDRIGDYAALSVAAYHVGVDG